MPTYDVIVIGTGGVGSATLWQLARRGARVLGIERFSVGHDRGSSHGETRIIRQAYFEHPDYVPLLRRTYELWRELEQLTQQTLYYPVGLLEIGPPGGVVVPGVLASARRYQVRVEELSRAECSQRFPSFDLPEDCAAVFEADAGYLLVENAVQAQAKLAQQQGAVLQSDEEVLEWKALADSVEVTTSRAKYSAARLIITAGAWAATLLQSCGIRLRVLRKHLYWHPFLSAAPSPASLPAFLYELPHGVFYGVPGLTPGEVKVGEHSGGREVLDPLTDSREVEPRDRARVEDFVARHLHGVATHTTRHSPCLYTMSPDEHFIVDHLPHAPHVMFAAGLSGHGFKFTPVLGEILADFALRGKSDQSCDFLSLRRFATLSDGGSR